MITSWLSRWRFPWSRIASDISDFAVMSQAYSEHFAEPYPARTAIGVAALPLGAAVEMDVVVG